MSQVRPTFKYLIIAGIILLFLKQGYSQLSTTDIKPPPSIPFKTAYINFDGEWRPADDPDKIGTNFSKLTNMRYTGDVEKKTASIETVLGYSKITTTAVTPYPIIQNGVHFNEAEISESHVLFWAKETTSNVTGAVYKLDTAIPGQGNFEGIAPIHEDSGNATQGRLSLGPDRTVFYANGEEEYVWTGDEVSPDFVGIATGVTSDIVDYTDEAINSLTTVANAVPLSILIESSETGNSEYAIAANGADYQSLAVKFTATHDGQIHGVTFRAYMSGATSNLYAMIYTDSSGPSAQVGANSNNVDITTLSSSMNDVHFTFAESLPVVTAGNYYWAIIKADSNYVSGVSVAHYEFSTEPNGAYYEEAAGTWAVLPNDVQLSFQVQYKVYLHIGNAAATKGQKIYITSGQSNYRSGVSPEVQYRNENGWVYVSDLTDNTESGGSTFAQTEFLSYDSLVDKTKPFHTSNKSLFWTRTNWNHPILADRGTNDTDFQPEDQIIEINDASNDYRLPDVETLSETTAIVAYQRGGNAYSKRSADGGETWGSEVTIKAAVASNFASPSITSLSNGRLLAAIKDSGAWNAPGNILVYYSDDQGASWSSLSTMSSLGEYHPQILALQNGNVLGIYNYDKGVGDGEPMAVISTDNGSTWESGITIESSTRNLDILDSFQARNGTIFVVYWDRGATYDLEISKSYDDGNTWTSGSTLVNSDNLPVAFGGMSYDENGVLYAFMQVEKTEPDAIHYIYSYDDGETWEETTNPPIAILAGLRATEPAAGLFGDELGLLFSHRKEGDSNRRTSLSKKTTITSKHFDPAYTYHVTTDMPWQPLTDIWDEVNFSISSVQKYDATTDSYEDVTLEALSADYYDIDVGGMGSDDYLIIISEKQLQGLYFEIASGNTTALTSGLSVYYYNGDWQAVSSQDDGTSDPTGLKPFYQSGALVWYPEEPEDENLVQEFGVWGYKYLIRWDGTLDSSGDEDGTEIESIYGIPAPLKLEPCNFHVLYRDMIMRCGFPNSGKGNQIKYSAPKEPFVHNGENSSQGINDYSIYVGDGETLTAGIELYNSYGNDVESGLVLGTNTKTYMLFGSSKDDFTVHEVSPNFGIPAPFTLTLVEGYEIVEGISRNAAVWLSYSGPIIFDGIKPEPIKGLENYFDPNDDDYVGSTAIKDARAGFDAANMEWNLVVGDYWFVLDLNNLGKKNRLWYQKSVGTAPMPQSFVQVLDGDGNKYLYSGVSVGYVMRQEYGTSWDGNSIAYEAETGDIYPSGEWYESIIRRVRLDYEVISEEATADIAAYEDTSTSGTTLGSVNLNSGAHRLERRVFSHPDLTARSFRFNLSGSISSTTAFQPHGLGYQFRERRLDIG